MNKRSIKYLNFLYYSSAVHFEFGGIEINTIILFFSVKNQKNIIPVIEGSAVVYHFRNVSTVKFDSWLE